MKLLTKFIYRYRDFLSLHGMHGMNRYLITQRKISQRFSYTNFFVKETLFLFFICFIIAFPITTVIATESFYTPAVPQGVTVGFLDVDYEYTVFTTNTTAYWLFDWGDGTRSSWLQLEEGNNSITQTHRWTSAGIYPVRVEFKNEFFKNGVWSEPILVTMNIAYSDDVPLTPVMTSATIEGTVNCSYYYGAMGIDLQEDVLQYRFDWGDGTRSSWTASHVSGERTICAHQWNHSSNYTIRVQSRDQHWLESPWSSGLNITIVPEGNYKLSSREILYLNRVYHHIECANDGEKTFYNTTSGSFSTLDDTGDRAYLLDDNGDGRWEYTITPSTGSIEPYIYPVPPTTASFQIPWLLLLIIGIILSIIFVVLFLVKKGYLYMYEEVVVEK